MAPMGARRFRLTPGRETNRWPSGGASDREVVGLLGRKGGLSCLYLWMRFSPESDTEYKAAKGLFGKQASEAPAYIQDFALLEIECSRR